MRTSFRINKFNALIATFISTAFLFLRLAIICSEKVEVPPFANIITVKIASTQPISQYTTPFQGEALQTGIISQPVVIAEPYTSSGQDLSSESFFGITIVTPASIGQPMPFALFTVPSIIGPSVSNRNCEDINNRCVSDVRHWDGQLGQ